MLFGFLERVQLTPGNGSFPSFNNHCACPEWRPGYLLSWMLRTDISPTLWSSWGRDRPAPQAQPRQPGCPAFMLCSHPKPSQKSAKAEVSPTHVGPRSHLLRMRVGGGTCAFSLEPRVGDCRSCCSVDSRGLEVLSVPRQRPTAQSGTLPVSHSKSGRSLAVAPFLQPGACR